jgi:hypothetical protein
MCGVVLAFIIACGTMVFGGIAGAHQGFKAGEVAKMQGDQTYIIHEGSIYTKDKLIYAHDTE